MQAKMLKMIKKDTENGPLFYVLGRTAGWHVFELFWDKDAEAWKPFTRPGALYDAVYNDPDPEWVRIMEEDLPAPLPAEYLS